MKDKKNIGNERLKATRSLKKITQKELAEMTGLTQTTITKIERGETTSPSIDIAIKIANALGENVYTLFADELLPLNSSDAFKFSLNSDNQTNELKAENEILKEQLDLSNQQSVLKDKLISGYEKQIEATKKYSMYWPRVLILSTLVELNDELKKNLITKEGFKEKLETLYSVAALAFLFSIEFDNKIVDELEEYLMSRNEKNSMFYFKTFIDFVRKIQDKYKELK